MLTRLEVRNFALIESVDIELGPGLNVITGETGAGKSLLVGALELLLGRKPKAGTIRAGADRAEVEGRFEFGSDEGERESARRVTGWLAQHLPRVLEEWSELPADEARELLITRTVATSAKGALRSRALVNDHPVKSRELAALCALLVEIHGQNDHQRLLDEGEQLRLVDAYGRLGRTVATYKRLRGRFVELVDRALSAADREHWRAERLVELEELVHELSEIAPEPGERERLVERRELLRHAEELATELGAVAIELNEADDAVADRLRSAVRVLERWSDRVGALREPLSELEAAAVHAEEAARALIGVLDGIEADPAELERVDDRLRLLDDLARKHGVRVDDLARSTSDLEDERAQLEREEAGGDELEDEIRSARVELEAAASELTRARLDVSERLPSAIGRALAALGLETSAFGVRVATFALPAGSTETPWRERQELDRRRFGERGADRIEFTLAANPGEPPRPLARVASGGEAARTMLALRTVLAGTDRGRTLFFDEIDAGVGGRLGPAVGAHLRDLARHHQVLCVTHLPAIAAVADRHLCVAKATSGRRTSTAVRRLEGEERVGEIADMIAGGAELETARAEARRLLTAKR